MLTPNKRSSPPCISQIAKSKMAHIVLNLTDDTPLMVMVNAIGFSTVGGFLDMSQPITESAAAWIHSRDKDGDVTVSTQHLFVDPAVYASYKGQDAFNASVNSYGGTSKGSAFLSPKSNLQRNATNAVSD